MLQVIGLFSTWTWLPRAFHLSSALLLRRPDLPFDPLPPRSVTWNASTRWPFAQRFQKLHLLASWLRRYHRLREEKPMLVGSRQTFGDKDEPTVSFVFAAIFSPPSIADANVFPVFLLNFIIKHEFRSLRLIKKCLQCPMRPLRSRRLCLVQEKSIKGGWRRRHGTRDERRRGWIEKA